LLISRRAISRASSSPSSARRRARIQRPDLHHGGNRLTPSAPNRSGKATGSTTVSSSDASLVLGSAMIE
jgi:hypothetical protein